MHGHPTRALGVLLVVMGVGLIPVASAQEAESEHAATSVPRGESVVTLVREPVWLEVEDALDDSTPGLESNFPTMKASGWLFGGHALFVDQADGLEGGAYHVSIDLRMQSDGPVSVWLAGSPPAEAAADAARWVSPLSVRVDDGPEASPSGAAAVTAWYADGSNAWYRAGEYQLTAGLHTITITVTGPRARDGHYAAELDAVLVLPGGWTPAMAELLQWSDEQWLTYLAAAGVQTGVAFDVLRRQLEAVRDAPSDVQAQIALAKSLREAELWEATERVWRAVLAVDPHARAAFEGLAELAAERERWAEAATWYERVASQVPEDLAVQRQYLDLLEASEQLDKAAAVLDRLLEHHPEDRELLAKASELARWRNKPQDAVAIDMQRFALGQLDREGTEQLIDDLAGLDRAEEALTLVRSMSPERHADTLKLMERVIADLPDPHRQAEEYQELVALRPDDFELRRKYAMALESADELSRAVEEYRALAAALPDDVELLRQLAERQRWVNDLTGAIDTYRAALLLDPDHDATRRALLAALIDASRLAEAADEARTLLARHPMDRELHRTLAKIHTWNDRPREALKEYEQALLLGPRDAELSVEMGKLYEWLGRDREAAAEYQLAVKTDPNHTEARERLRAMRLREREDEPGPGLRWAYFEDSRHIARWVAAGRIQWKMSDDPVGLEYGLMGVHDRERAANGQWVVADWEHQLAPNWSIRTEQGLAVYDTDHASYQYNWMVGHRPSDRWAVSVATGRHDVWQTPQAVEQGISVSDVEVASKSAWTDRLEHVASVTGGWYTDSNKSIEMSHEWIYRLFSEPLVTVGGGYTYEDYAQPSDDDAYYTPTELHTGFARAGAYTHPSDRLTYGGEYIVATNDSSSVSHEVKGSVDYRIVKDLWWRLFGRYFSESARFGEDRYFEREIGSHLKWKF